jgi:hypothetical protein
MLFVHQYLRILVLIRDLLGLLQLACAENSVLDVVGIVFFVLEALEKELSGFIDGVSISQL